MQDNFTWGGQWKTPEMDFFCGGELLIDKNEGIISLDLFYRSKTPFDDRKYFANEEPVIWGELSNGANATLVECHVIKRSSDISVGISTLTIYAKYMITGKHYPSNDLFFRKMKFYLTEIVSWSELCKMETDFDQELGLRWKAEKEIIFPVREGVSLRMYPELDSRLAEYTGEKIEIEQHVATELSYDTLVDINTGLKDIDTIINLISLAVINRICIKQVQGFRDDIFSQAGEMHIPYPIDIYINKPTWESTNRTHRFDRLFSLQDLLLDKAARLKLWFQKYPLLRPVIDLYTSVL